MSDTPDPRPTGWRRPLIGPFSVAHVVMLLVVLAVVALLLMILSRPIEAPGATTALEPGSGFYQTNERTEGLSLGQVAPELQAEVDGVMQPLLDLDGDVISLEALRGSPVWLSFFASWCPPCQEETPVLRDMWHEYADDGLEMIAVSVQETTVADVTEYAETYSLPYTIGFDATSAVFDTYQGFGLPTHVFLDEDGVIAHLQYGPLDREAATEIIEPLLAGNTS